MSDLLFERLQLIRQIAQKRQAAARLRERRREWIVVRDPNSTSVTFHDESPWDHSVRPSELETLIDDAKHDLLITEEYLTKGEN